MVFVGMLMAMLIQRKCIFTPLIKREAQVLSMWASFLPLRSAGTFSTLCGRLAGANVNLLAIVNEDSRVLQRS